MSSNSEESEVSVEKRDRESSSNRVSVYGVDSRANISFIQTFVVLFQNVVDSREMVWQLLKRDLTAQYKKSFIGVPWMLVAPIVAVVPWIFASHVKVYNPGEMLIPLALYLVVGRSMWSLFSGFYESAANSLGAGNLMLQVNFPHEVLFVKNTLGGVINFMLSFVTTIAMMMVYKVYPGWEALLLPLMVLPLFFLGAAIGLLVAMVRVVAFDVSRIIAILMGFAMWTTPLLYSDTKPPSPILKLVNDYNPLTYLV
ncbi:MAG: ABC transporter permease, partial [Kiritimatiellae bacterium]|nr:ABC transporter permease [Kiritimatiellia bacterium]